MLMLFDICFKNFLYEEHIVLVNLDKFKQKIGLYTIAQDVRIYIINLIIKFQKRDVCMLGKR